MHTQHLTIALAGLGLCFLSLSYFICRAVGVLIFRKISLKKQFKQIREAA